MNLTLCSTSSMWNLCHPFFFFYGLKLIYNDSKTIIFTKILWLLAVVMLASTPQCLNLFKNGQEIHVICMLHIKLIQHFLDNLTCLQSYLVPFLIHLENWRFFQITNFSCQNSKKWAIIKTFLLIIRFWRNLVRL